MRYTKKDKGNNRYYIDTAKAPIVIVGTKAVGSPITKLAMYEAIGEPTKIAKLLENAGTLVKGEGFTPKQAARASAECERVARETAAGVVEAIIEQLEANGHLNAAAYLRLVFGTKDGEGENVDKVTETL